MSLKVIRFNMKNLKMFFRKSKGLENLESAHDFLLLYEFIAYFFSHVGQIIDNEAL